MPTNAHIRQALIERGFTVHEHVITEYTEIFADATIRRFLVTAQLARGVDTPPNDAMHLLRLALFDELELLDSETPGWTRRHVVRSATFTYSNNGAPRDATIVKRAGGRGDGVTRLHQLNAAGMLTTMENVLKSSDTVTIHDIKLTIVIEYDRKVCGCGLSVEQGLIIIYRFKGHPSVGKTKTTSVATRRF